MIEIINRDCYNNILEKSIEKIVILVFTAQQQRMYLPTLALVKKIEEKYPESIIAIIDVIKADGITVDHHITNIPTFIILRNKKIVCRLDDLGRFIN